MFPGKTQYAEGPGPADLRIHRTVHSSTPLNWRKTGLRIRKEKPDLVIIAYWLPLMAMSLGSIARIIRGNRHTRIVGLVHNLIPHEKRPGDAVLNRYFVNSCDAFITLSKEVLADIRQLTNKPAVFAPHPVYDSFGDAVPATEARAAPRLGREQTLPPLLRLHPRLQRAGSAAGSHARRTHQLPSPTLNW